MWDVILSGIVMIVIGSGVATGLHYLFARQFAKRYQSGIDLDATVARVRNELLTASESLRSEITDKVESYYQRGKEDVAVLVSSLMAEVDRRAEQYLAYAIGQASSVLPKALPAVREVLRGAFLDAMQEMSKVQEAEAKDLAYREEMRQRGIAGNEAKKEKKAQKELRKHAVIEMIESKYPGASTFIPMIEQQFGVDVIEMAADNPEMAMKVLDGVMKNKKPGSGGSSSGWISR